jgi:hypothetical protein
MDKKIENRSPESLEEQKPHTESNPELWEPPFDRWLRLTDDLLRDWPHSATNYPDQAL